MKKIVSVLLLIASFCAFADRMEGDWDAMGNPVPQPSQPAPQPIYPHPEG